MESHKPIRNTSVELLRFAFMFLIVLLHVYTHGSDLDYESIYSMGNDLGMALHLSLFCLCKIGVTGFMFISGYYGIRASQHKIIDLILITFFYLVLLTPFGDNVSVLLFLHPFDGWWFVSAYLFIVFLSPLIEIGIKNISKQTFRNVVIATLLYTYFAKALGAQNSHDAVFLLTIYLAARYYRLYLSVKFNELDGRKSLRIIGISSVIVLMFFPIFASMAELPMNVFNLFVQNNNPLLFIIVCWLVHEADTHVYKNNVLNKLLSSTLAIYLITDASNVRPVLTRLLLPEVMHGIGLVYILLVCFGCLLIDQLRITLFDYGYKIAYKLFKLRKFKL